MESPSPFGGWHNSGSKTNTDNAGKTKAKNFRLLFQPRQSNFEETNVPAKNN